MMGEFLWFLALILNIGLTIGGLYLLVSSIRMLIYTSARPYLTTRGGEVIVLSLVVLALCGHTYYKLFL